MNPNDFPSFDDYIEEVKRRQREGTLLTNQPGQTQQQKYFNEQQVAQSKQAEARAALAREQELAIEKVKQETTLPHVHVKGRYYLGTETNKVPESGQTATPPDLERVAYIKALRKRLNVTQAQTEKNNDDL